MATYRNNKRANTLLIDPRMSQNRANGLLKAMGIPPEALAIVYALEGESLETAEQILKIAFEQDLARKDDGAGPRVGEGIAPRPYTRH